MTGLEQVALKKLANNQYELYALLKQRYSPRVFADKAITAEEINKLFEAVRWSASSFNIQPWRFIYAMRESEAYDKIVGCLSDSNQKWATNAPVLMLSVYKEKKGNGDDNFHALHDLGLALGGMTVQAQYMGIALHHMAGVDRKKAQKVFEVPEGYRVNTAIALGYYGGDVNELSEELKKRELAERERMPQTEFAFKNAWKSDTDKNGNHEN